MIHLISGNFGPFEPEFPIELPLWAAIMLKKQKKCRLIPPNWMKDVWFIEKIKQEKKKNSILQKIYHFIIRRYSWSSIYMH